MTGWPRPDFLGVAPRTPRAAWAFAAFGAAALATAGGFAAWQQIELDRMEASVRTSPPRRATLPGPSSGDRAEARKDDVDQRRSARRLVDDLHYPWAPALGTLEASTPEGVRWLSFDLASEGGDLRLEGAAPAAGAALRAVESFSARPGWRDVALLRLQRESRDAATAPLRFAIAARLDPAELLRAADPANP